MNDSTPTSPPLFLRNMIPQDLPAVLDIERAGYSHPWTEGMFRDCLKGGNLCRVAVSGECIVGHLLVSVAAGECQVFNICCHPGWRRRGVAEALLTDVFATAWDLGAEAVFLEVRVSNGAACALYEKLGFERVGKRKGYYPADHGREDAWVYRLDLTLHPTGGVDQPTMSR
jgi:ribosomal-protein-alanine N-acetyltransferase